jgi:hypothetical protein
LGAGDGFAPLGTRSSVTTSRVPFATSTSTNSFPAFLYQNFAPSAVQLASTFADVTLPAVHLNTLFARS